MGFGLLGIFSIGLPILVLGVILLIPLTRSRLPGAGLILVGAALPWLAFSLEGYISPDCADGISRIGRHGAEHFECRLMEAPSEYLPLIAVSLAVVIVGVALYATTRRRAGGSRASTLASPHL